MKIKGLALIAIVCVGLLVWFSIIDTNFDKIIRGKAVRFEYFIETILLSYLAAYIFYLLNIYLVEEHERKTILPFIARNVLSYPYIN